MKIFVLTLVAIIGFALSMPVEHEPDSDLDEFEEHAADSIKTEADEKPVESQDESDEFRDLEEAVPEDVEFPEFDHNLESVYNENDIEGEEEDETDDTTPADLEAAVDADSTHEEENAAKDEAESRVGEEEVEEIKIPEVANNESEAKQDSTMADEDDTAEDEAETRAGEEEVEEIKIPEDANNESEVKQDSTTADEDGKEDEEDESLDIPEISAEEDEELAYAATEDTIEDTPEAADEAYATDVVSDATEKIAKPADTIKPADAIKVADEPSFFSDDDFSDMIE